MGIAGDEHDAMQAAAHERAQEAGPQRAALAGADVESQHLALALLVDGDRHDHRHRLDPAALADLLDLGVKPQVRIAVLIEAPLAEGLHPAVELGAHARHLALADAVDAEAPGPGRRPCGY